MQTSRKKKITSHRSEEIEKERGCGLIDNIEFSGIWVSQKTRDILLNDVPTVSGKQVDIHFQLWKPKPIFNFKGANWTSESEIHCE